MVPLDHVGALLVSCFLLSGVSVDQHDEIDLVSSHFQSFQCLLWLGSFHRLRPAFQVAGTCLVEHWLHSKMVPRLDEICRSSCLADGLDSPLFWNQGYTDMHLYHFRRRLPFGTGSIGG